jgi:hypothetical protein
MPQSQRQAPSTRAITRLPSVLLRLAANGVAARSCQAI